MNSTDCMRQNRVTNAQSLGYIHVRQRYIHCEYIRTGPLLFSKISLTKHGSLLSSGYIKMIFFNFQHLSSVDRPWQP